MKLATKMNIKGRYYLFALIIGMILAFVLRNYYNQTLAALSGGLVVYIGIVTWENFGRWQKRDFGHHWYACRSHTYKDLYDFDRIDYSFYNYLYSEKMLK